MARNKEGLTASIQRAMSGDSDLRAPEQQAADISEGARRGQSGLDRLLWVKPVQSTAATPSPLILGDCPEWIALPSTAVNLSPVHPPSNRYYKFRSVLAPDWTAR
jgi:hypothetical protein